VKNRLVLMLALAALGWGPQSPAQQEDPLVAVIDTGTDANVNVVGGFNFVNGTRDTSDIAADSHGTATSLIINQMAPGIPQRQLVVGFRNPGATEAAAPKVRVAVCGPRA